MPTEPTVSAIMLTRDRPELARRAVECFRAQTYGNKLLFGLDTAEHHAPGLPWGDHDATVMWCPGLAVTVSELRNYAIRAAFGHHDFDVLLHWDDDDYSHPNRIAEQVALLQSSGADCVGYREMLFWRELPPSILAGRGILPDEHCHPTGEAWLYSNPNPGYALGTSLCYWRKTWERKPFPNTSVGEDLQFITGLKCVGVASALESYVALSKMADALEVTRPIVAGPRMIARIHGGNSSGGYDPRKMAAEAAKPDGMWRRVPEWDTHCRSVMEGK